MKRMKHIIRSIFSFEPPELKKVEGRIATAGDIKEWIRNIPNDVPIVIETNNNSAFYLDTEGCIDAEIFEGEIYDIDYASMNLDRSKTENVLVFSVNKNFRIRKPKKQEDES